jgi:hypothetical protein
VFRELVCLLAKNMKANVSKDVFRNALMEVSQSSTMDGKTTSFHHCNEEEAN